MQCILQNSTIHHIHGAISSIVLQLNLNSAFFCNFCSIVRDSVTYHLESRIIKENPKYRSSLFMIRSDQKYFICYSSPRNLCDIFFSEIYEDKSHLSSKSTLECKKNLTNIQEKIWHNVYNLRSFYCLVFHPYLPTPSIVVYFYLFIFFKVIFIQTFTKPLSIFMIIHLVLEKFHI